MSEQVTINLNKLFCSYLDDLLAVGLFGDTREDAAKNLVEEGVRRHIANKLIQLRQPPPAKRGRIMLTDIERVALTFLVRNAGDEIGIIDDESKLAAGIVFLRLMKKGYAMSVIGDNGPAYYITPAGRAALTRGEG